MFSGILSILLLMITCSVRALPQVTLTGGATTQTSQVCTTLYASTNVKGPISTKTQTVTLRPHVVLVWTDAAPVVTVTPSTSTFWETLNIVSQTTVTNPTLTNTFSSTSWELSTATETQTITDTSVTTFSTTTTSTSVSVHPTPDQFTAIVDSFGAKNYSQGLVDQGSPAGRYQALGQRGFRDRKGDTRPEEVESFELDYLGAKSPFLVDCNVYLSPTWTEKIALAHHTVTTEAPTPISTKTTTVTLTSTLTEAPSVSTTITTTSTRWTIESVLTSTLDVVSTTTTLEAAVETSFYEACGPNNILGPRIDNGEYLGTGELLFPDTNPVSNYEKSAYDCCVYCQATPDCEFSTLLVRLGLCYRFLADANVCRRGQDVAHVFPEDYVGFFEAIYSNGACGVVRPFQP